MGPTIQTSSVGDLFHLKVHLLPQVRFNPKNVHHGGYDRGRLRANRRRRSKPLRPSVTGSYVRSGEHSGAEVKIDGQDLLIMKESDIMGVLTDVAGSKKAA